MVWGWQHPRMPARRMTEKTKIFEIEIVLEDVRPPVRRLVQVPGDASLAVLHEVVQSAMGWTNSHLHEFEIGGQRYGMSDPDWDDGDVADEAKVKLFRLVGLGEVAVGMIEVERLVAGRGDEHDAPTDRVLRRPRDFGVE